MTFSTFDSKSFIVYIVEGSNSIRGEFNYQTDGIYVSSPQVEIGSPATNWIGGETTRAVDQVTVELGGFRLYTEGIQIGATGPAGADSTVLCPLGVDGRDGIDGIDGALGINGVDGVDGAPRRDGVDGAPCRDGVDGVDGAPGRDGVDGVDGAPGRDGIDGAPGRDGVDDVDGAL